MFFGNFSFGTGSTLPYPPVGPGNKYPYFVTVKLGPKLVHSFLCETYGLAEAQAILVMSQLKKSADTVDLLKNGVPLRKWAFSDGQWSAIL